jgi:TPR repeat protein
MSDFTFPQESADIAALKAAAEQDDPEAQYALGIRYGRGEGVLQDIQLGLYWVNRAADKKYPKAIAFLRDMP